MLMREYSTIDFNFTCSICPKKIPCTTAGVEIFIASTILTVRETVEISCTVTNISADSITLLRDNQMVAEIRSNTQLNVTISVNDSLHESQFSCEAQLTGSSVAAYSNPIQVTVAGKDILLVIKH